MKIMSLKAQKAAVQAARGFTLVEILAVIAVIAILMSVASVGIQKMDQGQATSTGLAVSEAIFDEARSAAVGRGTRSRVVIHNNPATDERDRFLRYMAVAIFEDDKWVINSRGTSLPSGVWFDRDAADDARSKVSGLGTYGTMSIALPGDRGAETSCYYYEFNAEGLCVDADAKDEPGAAFVLAGGVMPANASKPTVKGNNRVGFVVWRNGRTSIFRNPDQITSNS